MEKKNDILVLEDSINLLVSAIEADDYELQKKIMTNIERGTADGAE